MLFRNAVGRVLKLQISERIGRLSFVHMSKLRPIAKICQLKSQSLDSLANKVAMNLRSWAAVAESPHWFAWPNSATTKNEQCSPAAKMQILRSKSKKGGGVFFWQSRSFFVKMRPFSCSKGEKMHKKGRYLRRCTNP